MKIVIGLDREIKKATSYDWQLVSKICKEDVKD